MHLAIITLIGLSAFANQVSAYQPDDLSDSLQANVPPREGDEDFTKLFTQWDGQTSIATKELPEKTGSAEAASPKYIPRCSSLNNASKVSLSANWVPYHTGKVGKQTGTVSVDVDSIRYCKNRKGELIANFTRNTDFGTGDVTILVADYNCMKKDEEGYNSKSWLYMKNGTVEELTVTGEMGNPIPISPAYRLVKYICDINHDKLVAKVPEPALVWEDLTPISGDVKWSVLSQESYTSDYYGRTVAKFWIRKDYSQAKWTKYRYTYAFDKITCEDARYDTGTSYGFLPNANQGQEVYESSMSNIAPGSVQAAVMAKVCALP